MSRIIKFRAFMPKEHKMINTVFGSVGFRDGDAGRTFYRPTAMVDDDSNLFGHDWILMQYTGLKDKNGVEIYEGDVVEYEALKGHFGVHQIIYEPKAAAFLLQAITKASRNPIGMKYLGDIARSNRQYDTRTYELCEVIGNIYENSELLEQSDAA